MASSYDGDHSTNGSSNGAKDEGSNLSSSRRKSSGFKFGVKSYLHHFYEDCTGLGEIDVESGCDQQSSPSRRFQLCRRVGLSFSIIFILIGILLLLIGFLVPARNTESVQNGKTIINTENVRFNEFLTYSRWVGASCFCLGGVVLAISIALLNRSVYHRRSEALERRVFEQRLLDGASSETASRGTDEFGNLVEYGACTSPVSSSLTSRQPIPASLKEVTKIQPP